MAALLDAMAIKKTPKLLQRDVFRNLQNFAAQLRAISVLIRECWTANFHSYGLIVSESCSPLYMADRVIKLDSVSPHCPQPETEK